MHDRGSKSYNLASLGYTQGRMASPLKPASQVTHALGPVPSSLYSLASPAPRLVPEGGYVHGVPPAPGEVTAVDSWISVEEEQVGG